MKLRTVIFLLIGMISLTALASTPMLDEKKQNVELATIDYVVASESSNDIVLNFKSIDLTTDYLPIVIGKTPITNNQILLNNRFKQHLKSLQLHSKHSLNEKFNAFINQYRECLIKKLNFSFNNEVVSKKKIFKYNLKIDCVFLKPKLS